MSNFGLEPGQNSIGKKQSKQLRSTTFSIKDQENKSIDLSKLHSDYDKPFKCFRSRESSLKLENSFGFISNEVLKSQPPIILEDNVSFLLLKDFSSNDNNSPRISSGKNTLKSKSEINRKDDKVSHSATAEENKEPSAKKKGKENSREKPRKASETAVIICSEVAQIKKKSSSKSKSKHQVTQSGKKSQRTVQCHKEKCVSRSKSKYDDANHKLSVEPTSHGIFFVKKEKCEADVKIKKFLSNCNTFSPATKKKKTSSTGNVLGGTTKRPSVFVFQTHKGQMKNRSSKCAQSYTLVTERPKYDHKKLSLASLSDPNSAGGGLEQPRSSKDSPTSNNILSIVSSFQSIFPSTTHVFLGDESSLVYGNKSKTNMHQPSSVSAAIVSEKSEESPQPSSHLPEKVSRYKLGAISSQKTVHHIAANAVSAKQSLGSKLSARTLERMCKIENLLLDCQLVLESYYNLKSNWGMICNKSMEDVVFRLICTIGTRLQQEGLGVFGYGREDNTHSMNGLLKLIREKLVYARLLHESMADDSCLKISHRNTLKDSWEYCRFAGKKLMNMKPIITDADLTSQAVQSIRLSNKRLRKSMKKFLDKSEPLTIRCYRYLKAVDEMLSNGIRTLRSLTNSKSSESRMVVSETIEPPPTSNSVVCHSEETMSRICRSCDDGLLTSNDNFNDGDFSLDSLRRRPMADSLIIACSLDDLIISDYSSEKMKPCISGGKLEKKRSPLFMDLRDLAEKCATDGALNSQDRPKTGSILAKSNLSRKSKYPLTTESSSINESTQPPSQIARPLTNKLMRDNMLDNKVDPRRPNPADPKCPGMYMQRSPHTANPHAASPHCHYSVCTNLENGPGSYPTVYPYCGICPVEPAGYFMSPVHPAVQPIHFVHGPYNPYVMNPSNVL